MFVMKEFICSSFLFSCVINLVIDGLKLDFKN